MKQNIWILVLTYICMLHHSYAPPVDKKKDDQAKDGPDFKGIEYRNYLQEVVEYLEKDEAFARELKNATEDDIKSGNIAKKLDLVHYNIRNRLDEAKRMEIERLKKAAMAEMERNDIEGLGHRMIPMPNHLDVHNPHSFEEKDLRKLIESSTRDLEELDRKQREEFRKYEMEKELKYRDQLKEASEDKKKVLMKEHEDMIKQRKDHPRIHHPGSKAQLEQVWEQEDHLPRDEFDPLVFFSTHDIDGNGFLDPQEVEAILKAEVKQVYEGQGKKPDPMEEREEIRRMREHIFNETDTDKNGVISWNEFLKMTQGAEFDRDEGWQPIIDTDQQFTEEELKQYAYERQQQQQQMYGMHDPNQMGVQYVPQYGVPQGQQYHPPQGQQGGPVPHSQEAHQGYQVQGMVPQGMPGYHPEQGIPPHGMPPHPGQGIPPQGMQPHLGQGIPPQGMQPHLGQGIPPQGMQPHPGQGIPPQGVPSEAQSSHAQHQYAVHQQAAAGVAPPVPGQQTGNNQQQQHPPVPGNSNGPHH